MSEQNRPKVYIVGGGFGGLAAARALANAPVDVTLVDRRNHHVFQPLLYQVATASLSPADICAPIRSILRNQSNCRVVLAEVTGVDIAQKRLLFESGYAPYDYLVLAAGATHAYFGHDDWAHLAPGIKTIEDATALRRRILLAFESAEYEGSDEARRAALTFAIVGGGPTGAELAGAIKEIAGRTIPRDYKRIDTRTTRVIIFQGEDRILPTFAPALSERAKHDLEKMGVEIRLNARVTGVTDKGLNVGDEFIEVRNVFWAAGVKACPIGRSMGVPVDHTGRVIVSPDLSVPDHAETFVIGDMAAAKSDDTKKPVPGVAQGAIQTGEHVGHIIACETSGRSKPWDRKPFSYYDKGSMAVLGKNRAVAEIGKLKIGGPVAWLLWGGLHIFYLIGFRHRAQVMFSWFWNWLINARDARLITGEAHLQIVDPVNADFIRYNSPEAKTPEKTSSAA